MTLTTEEKVQIEALSIDLGIRIEGSMSVSFWPFPIIIELRRRITYLENQIQELEQSNDNKEESN